MLKILCNICREGLDISDFLFLKCGHGFCVPCTHSIANAKAECPMCRERFDDQIPHPVYVELVDATLEAQAKRVTDDLTNLEAGHVKGLAKRIREVEKQSSLDPADSAKLLEAASNVDEVVRPLLEELEGYRRSNDTNERLRHQNRKLSRKLEKLQAGLQSYRAETERTRLHTASLLQKQRVLKETLASQEAINEVHHQENLELRKEWTLEKQKYMDDLEKQTRELELQKRKLRAIAREKNKLKRQPTLQSVEDDSLIVE